MPRGSPGAAICQQMPYAGTPVTTASDTRHGVTARWEPSKYNGYNLHGSIARQLAAAYGSAMLCLVTKWPFPVGWDSV